LTELTGKKEWKWNEKEQKAFEKLKRLMSFIPVLAIPDPNREFQMEVDASEYAIGGVLSQRQTNNLWRPISFLSQALNKTERNYKIYD